MEKKLKLENSAFIKLVAEPSIFQGMYVDQAIFQQLIVTIKFFPAPIFHCPDGPENHYHSLES